MQTQYKIHMQINDLVVLAQKLDDNVLFLPFNCLSRSRREQGTQDKYMQNQIYKQKQQA